MSQALLETPHQLEAGSNGNIIVPPNVEFTNDGNGDDRHTEVAMKIGAIFRSGDARLNVQFAEIMRRIHSDSEILQLGTIALWNEVTA